MQGNNKGIFRFRQYRIANSVLRNDVTGHSTPFPVPEHTITTLVLGPGTSLLISLSWEHDN